MHELHIAQQIIDITNREMTVLHFDKISEIGLNVGILSDINPEALRFIFAASTVGTSLANARLEIKFAPVRGKCNSCHKNFVVDDFVFICPGCGSKDIAVIDGEDIYVAHLAGE